MLLTDAGVILVDSKFERAHDDIVAKVKSLTDKPIKYVILTHNHGDHADGAEKMEAMGATVIISADDRDNLARDPKAGWLPAVGYIGQMQLLLGAKTWSYTNYEATPGATRWCTFQRIAW